MIWNPSNVSIRIIAPRFCSLPMNDMKTPFLKWFLLGLFMNTRPLSRGTKSLHSDFIFSDVRRWLNNPVQTKACCGSRLGKLSLKTSNTRSVVRPHVMTSVVVKRNPSQSNHVHCMDLRHDLHWASTLWEDLRRRGKNNGGVSSSTFHLLRCFTHWGRYLSKVSLFIILKDWTQVT